MSAWPCPPFSAEDASEFALLRWWNVCTLTSSPVKYDFILHKKIWVSSAEKKESLWPSIQFTDKNIRAFSYHEPNRNNYLAFTLLCLFFSIQTGIFHIGFYFNNEVISFQAVFPKEYSNWLQLLTFLSNKERENVNARDKSCGVIQGLHFTWLFPKICSSINNSEFLFMYRSQITFLREFFVLKNSLLSHAFQKRDVHTSHMQNCF